MTPRGWRPQGRLTSDRGPGFPPQGRSRAVGSLLSPLPSDHGTPTSVAFTSTEPGSAEVSGPQAPSVCSQPRAVAAATQALPGATVSLAHRWSPVLLSGVWEGERGDGQGVPILAPWRLAVLTVQGPTCTGDHRLWPGDMSCPRSRSVGLRY